MTALRQKVQTMLKTTIFVKTWMKQITLIVRMNTGTLSQTSRLTLNNVQDALCIIPRLVHCAKGIVFHVRVFVFSNLDAYNVEYCQYLRRPF